MTPEQIADPINELWVNFIQSLPSLIVSIVIFIIFIYFAILAAGAMRRALQARKTDPDLIRLISKITRYSVVGLGAVVALQQVGFNLTAFLTGLGVVGFTIGFALQDISKNLVAGFLLIFQQPFDVGDAVVVGDDIGGIVITIDMRATEVHTWDGRVMLIPNADIYTKPITNFSRAKSRRVELRLGVGYENDMEKVRQTALKAIVDVPGLLETPAPDFQYKEFGPSTIDLALYYWVNTQVTDHFKGKDAGMVLINAAFEKAGISMPYPTQRLLLEHPNGNGVSEKSRAA